MDYNTFCNLFSSELLKYTEQKLILSREFILKNNGVSLDSLCILRPGSRCSPVIYLAPLFHSYENGCTMEQLCQAVLVRLQDGPPVSLTVLNDVLDFEKSRSRLVFRLVSKEENSALLEEVPWIPYLDLAVVFCLRLEATAHGQASMLIRNRHLSLWKLTAGELWDLARENTPKLLPPVITRMDQLLAQYGLSIPACSVPLPPLSHLYVLTNQDGIYGASCILYPDVLKDFAGKLNADLLILPSSIHEVLLFPDSGLLDYPFFRDTIQQVNQTEVSQEELLSDELYLYSNKTGTIRIWNSPFSHDKQEKGGKMNP